MHRITDRSRAKLRQHRSQPIVTEKGLEISHRTRWWCLKLMIVYLARDIPAFVMYCVNGAFCSSLLMESTDSL